MVRMVVNLQGEAVKGKNMKIWVDGSGWNGRETKYVILPENGKPLIMKSKNIKTNNEMEYIAVIEGIKSAENGDEIFSDSQLVVYQTSYKWRVKEKNLIPLHEEVIKLLDEKNITLTWIPRDENKAGKLI
jgi:ribonuclease HI